MNQQQYEALKTLQGNSDSFVYRLTVIGPDGGIIDVIYSGDWSDITENIGSYNDSNDYVIIIETLGE